MKRKTVSATKRIIKEEDRIEAKDDEIAKLEQKSFSELKKLETLEKQISKSVVPHPLLKITYKDIVRAAIGSLIGTLGHFAFFYGVEIAEKISPVRATVLYLVSLILVFGFMYYSGFRKVKEVKKLLFVPVRALVVFVTAIVMVTLVLFLFGFVDFTTPFMITYKIVSTLSLLAVLGAATADVLGHD